MFKLNADVGKMIIGILRWIVNSRQPLPAADIKFDEEALVELVDLHNLSGRFLLSIKNNDLPIFTSKLREVLRNQHLQTGRQVAGNIEAFRQIKKHLPNETASIIIKGVSTYVLGGHEKVMKTGDIDVLCSDTSTLVETLLKLNYRQTRQAFLHEVGEYTKGPVEVDIHDYFPVYYYAESLKRSDLKPDNNPGIWRQKHTMRQRRITFDALAKHSYTGEIPSTRDITVADPNILAVIICAHAFMNYTNLWSISHREKPYIRLGEIADLFELAKHPLFSEKTFLLLVKQFKAADAVEWAANIAVMLLGKNPLPVDRSAFVRRDAFARRFPRCLWWNFWAEIEFEDEGELIKKQWLSMDWITQELGANILSTEQGTTGKYSTVRRKGCQVLRRFITQEKPPMPMTVEILVSENRVLLRIDMQSDTSADIYRIRIDFGLVATEWEYSPAKQKQSLASNPGNANVKNRGGYFEVEFTYSWNKLGRSTYSEGKLPLLIGVAKQAGNGDLTSGTLIPLIVHF